MWLIFSAPLGLAFGAVTWALLRGRGGFSGLVLFSLLGSLAAFIGSLAAEAVAGYQADALTGVGAAAGAAVGESVSGPQFGAATAAVPAATIETLNPFSELLAPAVGVARQRRGSGLDIIGGASWTGEQRKL